MPKMGKKNTLKIEIRKSVHILRTRSKGRCKCVAECEKLLCHSSTKTLGAIVLFYTFSISLTFFNQRFIHVRNGSYTISAVCHSCNCYSWCHYHIRTPSQVIKLGTNTSHTNSMDNYRFRLAT